LPYQQFMRPLGVGKIGVPKPQNIADAQNELSSLGDIAGSRLGVRQPVGEDFLIIKVPGISVRVNPSSPLCKMVRVCEKQKVRKFRCPTGNPMREDMTVVAAFTPDGKNRPKRSVKFVGQSSVRG
jgi:hypothetical protein